ncbi:MAG: hypothetical protein ACE5HO_16115 [bacterium]
MTKFFLVVLFAGLLVLLIYRQILLSKIPNSEQSIPIPYRARDVLVLKRPGIRSIRIVRPIVNPLRFQVDLKRSPQPLEWAFLERTDKKADVAVAGKIDSEGNLVIKRMRDRGHPVAGQYIKKVLSSWKYVHYKMGAIQYYFNVPTIDEHTKIIIDVRGLRRNPRYTQPTDFIEDGQLFYVNGITRDNVSFLK